MTIVKLMDNLPDSIIRPAAAVWLVFARSLGELGATGRTALAWRWVLTGACPSPLALDSAPGRPPSRDELEAEAAAAAELGRGADPGGQVIHARFVLRWLVGDLDALPLWNGGPEGLHVTDGAPSPRENALIDQVHSWAMLAEWRHPWPDAGSATAESRVASGWARGLVQLLDWVCGESLAGPMTGARARLERPTLYEVALEVHQAGAALEQARLEGDVVLAARVEAIMETFAWLAGWSSTPPVDRHGHILAEECAERDIACGCDEASLCLRGECLACRKMPCVNGFGQDFRVG